MAVERTLSIIKPDATRRNLTGKINAVIEGAGLRIVAQKRARWTRAQAEKFYEEHKARPFYGELVEFMTSGPIILQVLEGENAIAKYREVFSNPYVAAGRRLVDDVIDPALTRKYLAQSLELLQTKRDLRPAKKHGLIPL